MTAPTTSSTAEPAIAKLVRQLDKATAPDEPIRRCEAVKAALQDFVRSGSKLDHRWLEPVDSGYARRLLHRDPEDRYSVVVMAWGPGQGTAIHDHAGLWCVECVCLGRIVVKSFRLTAEYSGERVQFAPESQVVAGVGEAGALIPPFDYHIIENPFEQAAATLHVYGGQMTCCRVFEPLGDGCHRPRRRQLSYNLSPASP
jgi:predicted metal-dependent enzyme (double-stranded beta helix superfamily)